LPLAVSAEPGALVHIVAGVFWIGLLYYSTSPRRPRWRTPQPTRAARAAPASRNTSLRGRCSGSAGRPLATWLGGAWLLKENFVNAFTFHSGFVVIASARGSDDHAAQRLGGDLPNQKKILGIVAATTSRRHTRAQGGGHGLARELRAVDSHALCAWRRKSHGLPFFHSG